MTGYEITTGRWCHCGGWWLHGDDAVHDAGMWHTWHQCGVMDRKATVTP